MTYTYLGAKSVYNLKSIALGKKHKRNKAKNLERKARKHRKPWEPPTYHQDPQMGPEFYDTREWKQLRWKVLIASDGRCSMCGRNKGDGVTLHVDHVRPRSRFPRLELEQTNLLVMCADCNLGKGREIWKPEARKSA
jgi:5-methylcytosine-specific restriction endonuclease McrA